MNPAQNGETAGLSCVHQNREDFSSLAVLTNEQEILKKIFVHSVDSLHGSKIESKKSPWWGDMPPLVLGAKNDKQSLKSLKQKCHLGIPPHLRCAVWISSVERAVNPHQPIKISDSYGTIGKKKIIDGGWDSVLHTVFPNTLDAEDAVAPDFGLTQAVLAQLINNDYGSWKPPQSKLLSKEEKLNQSSPIPPACDNTPIHLRENDINGVVNEVSKVENHSAAIPERGVKSLTRVLCAVQQVIGIEYCPLLPDIATILLTHMPESYAYATIREMINDNSRFIPVCQKDSYSWCKTFEFFVGRLFPLRFKKMQQCGALSPEGLEPIFKRFFTTLLKREDVLSFMDIFLIEGSKAMFRLAFSLVTLIRKAELKSLNLTDADSWWDEVRKKTLHPTFSFQTILDKMYPQFGKLSKRYPRRRILKRAIRINEQWAIDNMPIYIDQTPPKPIGLTDKSSILAKPTLVRSHLANWLPTALKSTKLDLIYSTELHGRSLASFYKECQRSKHTIILIEVIDEKCTSTIGMFASHAWAVRSSSYGDGECFLFRAQPNAKCFHWMPHFSDDMNDIEDQTIREQFMVSRSDYIAMGANKDGENGLRLDNFLTKGESYPAMGFGNEPLPGDGRNKFDVGIVEVFRLVREIDNKSIDGGDNLVWNLEGL